MLARARNWLTSLLVVLFGLAVFVPTLHWGLPTRETDKALFGDRKPWTGREIVQLLEGRSPEAAATEDSSLPPSSLIPPPSSLPPRGADVDANPILDRSKPVILNDTDAKRAEIVQRYRLMSKQPDEFIQFKALAEMSQRQGISKLDPRLYQYGGLWIYPVGALVRGAMLVGYIEQPPAGVPAKEFYLDHPDVFGKFYLVARAYSTMWGLVAALAIAWITRRLTNSNTLAFLAAAAFILLPVTRTAAHEAKPHLAGAALCLCAVIAATRFVETGKRRHALLAGALCGAAMAMVVSMILSLAVLPMMAWLRRGIRAEGGGMKRSESASFSSLIPPPSSLIPYAAAFSVYVLTNPFLIFNAIFRPEILRSNLGNSTAMYGVGNLGSAVASALRIAIEGITLGGVILAALSLLILAIARFTRRGDARVDRGLPNDFRSDSRAGQSESSPHAVEASLAPTNARGRATVAYLLAAPAACVLIQFVLLAAGKPAEYARFGLVVFAALGVTSALAFTKLDRRLVDPERASRAWLEWTVAAATVFLLLSILVPITTVTKGRPAWWMSALNSGTAPSRIGKPAWTLGLSHEPAPWSVMPLNLFRDQLILTKPAADPESAIYDVYLYPSNLSSQIGVDPGSESVDWARNRTQMLLGSLPTISRSPATSQAARP